MTEYQPTFNATILDYEGKDEDVPLPSTPIKPHRQPARMEPEDVPPPSCPPLNDITPPGEACCPLSPPMTLDTTGLVQSLAVSFAIGAGVGGLLAYAFSRHPIED